jgi:hypothetical protein
MAGSSQGRAGSDQATVDVAAAAELTGLSKDAIRGRIRRGALPSDVHNGRHRIALVALQRQGLLVEGGRYRSLLEWVESLEARLRTTLASREQAQQELHESQETLRMVWAMERHKEQELTRLGRSRQDRAGIRWPWRRETAPAPENG